MLTILRYLFTDHVVRTRNVWCTDGTMIRVETFRSGAVRTTPVQF